MSDSFCPRHGVSSRPIEVSGLRCDCPDRVLDAVAPLRAGKWVRAVLPDRDGHVLVIGAGEVAAVEERADQAVAEAAMAGYNLGLRR